MCLVPLLYATLVYSIAAIFLSDWSILLEIGVYCLSLSRHLQWARVYVDAVFIGDVF